MHDTAENDGNEAQGPAAQDPAAQGPAAQHPEGPAPPLPWPIVSSERSQDLIVARVRFDVLTNPRTGADLRRTVLEVPEWVNVVALTPDRELVVVEQFRFGTRAVTTEIPGGMVDPGEEPAAAARRELREESGFTSERWTSLGAVEPNPAFQDNLCHLFLAEDARRTHELELDPGEDIVVRTVRLADVPGLVQAGRIRHSLVVCALSRVLDLRH